MSPGTNGPNGDSAVFRFLAPTSGRYQVRGRYRSYWYQPSVDGLVSVLTDSGEVLFQGLLLANNTLTWQPYFWSGWLVEGKAIDLVVSVGANSIHDWDRAVIEHQVMSNWLVDGNAILDGYLASVVGELLEVQVWQNDVLVETLNGNYGPNGTFAFSPTVSGPAVLKFRFRTGLWRAVPVTLGATPIENLTVNMTNGDCDHDNEVGIGDYALLSTAYGLSVGDPGYDTNADLNGDTSVDIADYAILSANYGEVGD